MATSQIITLVDLQQENTILLNEVIKHELATSVTDINFKFGKEYLLQSTPVIESLLNTINERLRKIQILYYGSIEDLSDSIIKGGVSGLPYEKSFTFLFDTNIMTKTVNINSYRLYREFIDGDFQSFVLTTASIYENVVRLIEILCRKVIIHPVKSKPQSTTFLMYLELLNALIRLDYRTTDPLKLCIDRNKPFFDSYLPTINSLRNSFIHGYKSNTNYISNAYRVTVSQAPFNQNSPQLELKYFSGQVLDNTVLFVKDIITILTSEVSSSTIGIPF